MATKKKMLQAAAGFGGEPEGAWDLSYAYYNDPFLGNISTGSLKESFSVAAQEDNPTGVFFKPDGTQMYMVGVNGDDVNEYSLSTAWSVSSASYVRNFSVAAQDTSPNDLFLKPDGTKMYVIGFTGVSVYEYDLSTPWNISTALYLQSFSVSAEESNPQGVFFRPDGTKMYVIGRTGDDVNEYDLSTAWDVSTASYLQNFSVAAQSNDPRAVSFKGDGTKMYVGQVSGFIYQYDLSTAWDVSSASYATVLNVTSQTTTLTGLFIRDDGALACIVDQTADSVYQYSLGGFSVAAQDSTPYNMTFKTDGTKMYFVGPTSDSVHEYNLSTAWDISTASFLQSFSVAFQETNPYGVFFKPDGAKMYVIGRSGDDINEYDLSTAWDISTASFLQSFFVGTQATRPYDVFFKPDGAKVYVVGIDSDSVHEYNLSTAWDVSSASFLQTFSLTAQIINPAGLFFKEDGLKMYVVDLSGQDVNEYDLSTAWDVSTASYLQNFNVSVQENGPVSVFFKPTGDKMFILGYGRRKVFTYSLGVQE